MFRRLIGPVTLCDILALALGWYICHLTQKFIPASMQLAFTITVMAAAIFLWRLYFQVIRKQRQIQKVIIQVSSEPRS